jgi:adenosylhomocysteine nucleosidase
VRAAPADDKGPAAPQTMIDDHASSGLPLIVVVSADAEWRAVRALFPSAAPVATPLGECFVIRLRGSSHTHDVRFFQGGWGKIAAAASAEYVIGRWQPALLINLGTCGGFAGYINSGEIVLAERTIVYDILELMGDPVAALAHYDTTIDLAWLGSVPPHPVRRTLLVSGDRDLVATEITGLVERFGAVAGDWESGAIAWVAARHGTRCLILRGVTDLVGSTNGDADCGNRSLWATAIGRVMRTLVEQLPDWIDRAIPRRAATH